MVAQVAGNSSGLPFTVGGEWKISASGMGAGKGPFGFAVTDEPKLSWQIFLLSNLIMHSLQPCGCLADSIP